METEHAAPASRIESETALLPFVIAEAVCREGACLVNDDKPLEYADALAARAERCYRASAHFRGLLHGEAGRDWLYSFTRHWLSAELIRRHPALGRLLPTSFRIGRR